MTNKFDIYAAKMLFYWYYLKNVDEWNNELIIILIMITVTSYSVAVVMCVITMICWGSWANTQKLASKGWGFQLFYWDYSLGILLFTLLLGLTMGSIGDTGRGFIADIAQANWEPVKSALLGGIIFNLSNILLVVAIDIAGMAVAFPVGVGLALVLGVITTYMEKPEGNVAMLATGVALVVLAIIVDALAYKKLGGAKKSATPIKGIIVSIVAGCLMGFFFSYVVAAMGSIDKATGVVEAGKLTPYTATFFFALGIFISNFVFNVWMMLKPLSGSPVGLTDYFTKGNLKLHLIGMLGGAIWCCGTSFSFIASDAAGPALSYGLGQGATMVSALWGVFVWKEFKGAPKGTGMYIAVMFVLFISGLSVLVCSKL